MLSDEGGAVKFVNRGIELRTLQKLYSRSEASLMILYGRRRVGKTALLSHWLRKAGKAMFWTPTAQSSLVQLLTGCQFTQRAPTNEGIRLTSGVSPRCNKRLM